MSALYIILGFVVSCFAYENLALKQTYQQHPYPAPIGPIHTELIQASNAVDGLKSNLSIWGGQCVFSDNEQQTATWWVNLNNIVSIHHITVYYRTGNAIWGPSNDFVPRFLGFSLFVSNTTNKSEGVLCFKDTNFTLNTIPAVFNTTCLVHGQYVIYYNERLPGVIYPKEYSPYAHNELCELEVFGCPTSGYYGFTCNNHCPENCLVDCHIEKGTCHSCIRGYHGNLCETDCQYGTYGQDCVQKCYSNCNGCNNVNGSCDRGCKSGWTGYNCQQPCLNGFYGLNCTLRCSDKCTGCNNVNGFCDRGCQPGWKGDNCQESCPNGSYGQDCTQTCNDKCDGCNNVNGSCDRRCKPGWKGDNCQQPCHSGFYGQDCTLACNDNAQNVTTLMVTVIMNVNRAGTERDVNKNAKKTSMD
uniref:Platelet endothelial aggregation receptor 1-like n=1 Tax=Crassostrea virginica TaxID=6565 RepID=A0A8B8BPP5_CRAVI|nr:platelet endothelial aggregation receptor 1-like [Crassostrea virginica]